MSKYYSSSIAFGAKQTKTEKVVVNQNKIGDVTTDAVSGALTVDEVPTLDSLNPVSSDGVARSVAESVGSSVNLVQGSGITLTESSGNVTISADAQIPAYSNADSGKVLQVQADGTLAWVTL